LACKGDKIRLMPIIANNKVVLSILNMAENSLGSGRKENLVIRSSISICYNKTILLSRERSFFGYGAF
jgi:hypothetical protein